MKFGRFFLSALIGFASSAAYADGPAYDAVGQSPLAGGVFTGDIDLNGHLLLNMGNSGSDGTASGGWTMAAQVRALSFNGSTDGVVLLQNAAGTDFTKLQFGGTAGTFPGVCRTGTTLSFQVASDTTCGSNGSSNFAAVLASGYSVQSGANRGGVLGSAGLLLDSTDYVAWYNGADTATATQDAQITRVAAGSIGFNAASTATALGKGQSTNIVMAAQSLTFANNASKVTSGLVPDGAFLLGITTRVTTAGAGCTSVSIGDGTDVDMFGATTGITQNTTTTNADATAQFGRSPATAAMEVTITANGGNCTAGVWAVTAHYIQPTAATSN